MKKAFVQLYASLLVLYGISNSLYLLAIFFFKTLATPYMLQYLAWCESAALVTGVALFKTPVNLALAYGLLRFRSWARYGVIAGIATLPVLILAERLWWEHYRLNATALIFLLLSAGATLALFTRPAIKELFVDARPFRVVGITGLLAASVILLSLVPILCSIAAKWMCGKSGNPPMMHQTTYRRSPSPPEGMISVRLLDGSLPVYADSHIMNYDRIGFSRNPWRFAFSGPNGLIEYENHSLYENAFEYFPFFTARGYELERFFLTNQWNPLVLILRSIGRPQGSKYDAYELHSDYAKGFLTMHDDKVIKGRRKIAATFSLYDVNSPRCLSGMVIITANPGPDSVRIVAPFISSIGFLEPETEDAAMIHYRQGTSYLDRGQKLEGQVELANAFFLAPERKEFRNAFEATLSKMFRDLPHTLGAVKSAPGMP